MDDIEAAGGFWNWFGEAVQAWWKWFVDWWNNFSLSRWIQSAWNWIKSFKVWDYVENVVKWLRGKIVNFWNGVCDSLSKLSVSYPTGFECWNIKWSEPA